MKWPDSDDVLLFGGLGLFALGAGVVLGSTTDNWLAALGVSLMGFGFTASVVTFMAAGERE